MNASSAHYRTLTTRLEKGSPSLVGGDANVARARRGGKPRRKEMGRGRSLSRLSTPPGRPNSMADGVRLFGTFCAVKQPDAGMSIPGASRYLYLRRGQERRRYSDQPHVRDQCGRPTPEIMPAPPPFALRAPPGNGAAVSVVVRTWAERALSWTSSLSRSLWKIASYGTPTGVGDADGMIWSHRDALVAPVSSRPSSGFGHGIRRRPILSRVL